MELRAGGFSRELILPQLSDGLLEIIGFAIAPISDESGVSALCRVSEFWAFRKRAEILRRASEAAQRMNWEEEKAAMAVWRRLAPAGP